jgi:hypothetical protein
VIINFLKWLFLIFKKCLLLLGRKIKRTKRGHIFGSTINLKPKTLETLNHGWNPLQSIIPSLLFCHVNDSTCLNQCCCACKNKNISIILHGPLRQCKCEKICIIYMIFAWLCKITHIYINNGNNVIFTWRREIS